MSPMEQLSTNKSFGGVLTKYKFRSASLGGLETHINVFLPAASESRKVPVLFYLAGLTCNEDTGPWKGGFLRDAAAEGLAMIFPDTSPRGAGIEGEETDWDFGTGAGFYLNATSEAYSKHYNMYDFIVKELPDVLSATTLPLDLTKCSIFGHSMGGHGALSLYLRSLTAASPFRSASAFAPIANPIKAPWGEKAFAGYLAGGLEEGKQWDSCELLRKVSGRKVNILVDVGTSDNFFKQGQLLPENLVGASSAAGLHPSDAQVNYREGYDHSYYFISTFAESHIKFHAKILNS